MIKFALISMLVLTACAPTTFEFQAEEIPDVIHVTHQTESVFADPPVQYRLLADESHFVIWIENHAMSPVELIGDKSTIEDSNGDVHPLRGREIAPRSPIKLVLPPLADENSGESPYEPPPRLPQPGNPYDQPGFINVPGTGGGTQASAWHWDDNSEIRLDLLFQQGDHQFQQHFVIRKTRK
jgi:hypothetical protein